MPLAPVVHVLVAATPQGDDLLSDLATVGLGAVILLGGLVLGRRR